MDEIILIGAGGHARACIDVIELAGKYKIAGLVTRDEADFNENIGYLEFTDFYKRNTVLGSHPFGIGLGGFHPKYHSVKPLQTT